MPLHMNSFNPEGDSRDLLNFIIQNGMDAPEFTTVSDDRMTVHLTKLMTDRLTGQRIGKFVTTLYKDLQKDSYGLVDIDLTFDGGKPVALRFLHKQPQSSEANEYYDVEVEGGGQHLLVETVNRQFARKDEIEGSVLEVCASAFPFRLSVFDDIETFNSAFGFGRQEGGNRIGGLSETFASPASLMSTEHEEGAGDVYSWLNGVVKSIREVSVDFGRRNIDFTIAYTETALGVIPVAMHREIFDLSELAPEKILVMYAYVKADFAAVQ